MANEPISRRPAREPKRDVPATNRRPPGIVRWAILCIALAGAVLVWIGCGTPRAFAEPAAQTDPQALVEQTTERALAVLKQQHATLQQRPGNGSQAS